MRRLLIILLATAGLATACQGNVFELEVGQCFLEPEGTEISNVETVDCADDHDGEVYHLFDLPDGDYPGIPEVQRLGADGCFGAFDGPNGYPGQSGQNQAARCQGSGAPAGA